MVRCETDKMCLDRVYPNLPRVVEIRSLNHTRKQIKARWPVAQYKVGKYVSISPFTVGGFVRVCK